MKKSTTFLALMLTASFLLSCGKASGEEKPSQGADQTSQNQGGDSTPGGSDLPSSQPAKNYYRVTWVDYDGTTLEVDENVEEGAIPSFDGDEPYREAEDEEHVYTFIGWDKELSPVNGDVTFTASYRLDSIEVLFEFAPTSGGQAILGYRTPLSPIKKMTFPSSHAGENVVSIAAEAFQGANKIEEINLPSSLKSIGDRAFAQMGKLAKIKFNEGLEKIGEEAFADCSLLEAIGLPSSLLSLGKASFKGCQTLKDVTLPSSLSQIGEEVFAGCSQLERISLPFVGLSKEDQTPSEKTFFGAIFGKAGNKDDVMIRQFHSLEEEECRFYIPACLKKVVVRDVLPLKGAFSGCKTLHEISLPEGDIPDFCFYDCEKLSHFEASEECRSVGESGFEGCRDLAAISLPEGLESIGNRAFARCSSITSFALPSSMVSVGESIFAECASLKKIALPFLGGSLDDQQGSLAYYFSSEPFVGSTSATRNIYYPITLQEIYIEGGNVVSGAFNGFHSLSRIGLPEQMPKLTSNLFSAIPSLAEVVFTGPEDVKNSINQYRTKTKQGDFCISSIDESKVIYEDDCAYLVEEEGKKTLLHYYGKEAIYDIEEGVTALGDRAFSGCLSLVSVAFPTTLESVGDQIFYGASKLVEVIDPRDVEYEIDPISGKIRVGGTSIKPEHLLHSKEDRKVYVDENGYVMGNVDGAMTNFGYVGEKEEIVVPEGTEVICRQAYAFDKGIVSLKTPSSLKKINTQAFAYCRGIVSINLADSLEEIESRAFMNCSSLESFRAPRELLFLRSEAFQGCHHLQEAVFQDKTTFIGQSAFMDCPSLDSLRLPREIETVYLSSFQGAPIPYEKENGFLYFGNESNAKLVCFGSDNKEIESISLPEGCKVIAGSAFANFASLKTLSLPKSLTTIGASAFSGCASLANVTYGNEETVLLQSCFANCTSLTIAPIPAKTQTIHGSAFSGCTKIASASIPNSVSNVGSELFSGCTSLKNVSLPAKLTQISMYMFSGCTSLSGIALPASIESIGDSAFIGCTALASINLPPSLKTIAYGAFQGCTALTEINLLSTSLEQIGGHAFYNAGLTSVTLPSSCKDIGVYTFQNCASLTSVDLGTGVTSIGISTFHGCTKLTSVKMPSVKEIDAYAFKNTAVASIPISQLEHVRSYAFEGSSITSVSWPSHIESVSYYAFRDCKKLASVSLPSNLKEIKDGAFYGCTALKSISLPASAKTLGSRVFQGCTSLTGISLPSALEEIPNNFLYQCDALTSISIPSSVKKIGSLALYAKGLTTINFSGTIAQWNAIEKDGQQWHRGKLTVKCSNGSTVVS